MRTEDAHLEALAAVRRRTLDVIEGVTETDLERVHSPLLSPIVWDLAHVAAYADLWLARISGGQLLRPRVASTYDAGQTPRAIRGRVELLDVTGARSYLEQVDAALAAALPQFDLSGESAEPLLRDGYLVDLLVEHEEQHRETILQTLHLAEPGVKSADSLAASGPAAASAREDACDAPRGDATMAELPAGRVRLGATGGFAYDNELPAYEAELRGFRIDRTPVSVGAYAEFIADGGYRDARLWSAAGWDWRCAEQAERPLFWTADGAVRRFDRTELQPPETPVMNVSWFEAQAFARWRGARLPGEAEWEAAARHGVLQRTGEVWEWTASPLAPYPGFRAFPYPEYSEAFFGDAYRVLRGGSWATAARCRRVSFRNWDLPQRRQLFAGFRCADDWTVR